MKHRLVFSFFLSFFIVRVLGQGYTIKKYDVNDESGYKGAAKILQDKDGFIWLLSGDGLNRFDGKQFRSYPSKDKYEPTFEYDSGEGYPMEVSIDDRSFSSLRNGNVVFQSVNGMVTFDGQTYTRKVADTIAQRIYDDPINKDHYVKISGGTLDKYGNEWYFAKHVYRFDGKQTCLMNEKEGLCNDSLLIPAKSFFQGFYKFLESNIIVDNFGQTWFFSKKGAYRYNGKTFDHKNITIKENCRAVFEDKKGRLWIETVDSNSIYCFVSGILKKYVLSGLKPFRYFYGDIVEDGADNLYFSNEAGILKFSDNKFEYLKDVPPGTSLKIDNKNNLLISSATHGFYIYNGQTVIKINEFKNDVLKEIIIDFENNYWVVADNGLYRVSLTPVTNYNFSEKYGPGSYHWFQKIDSDDNILYNSDSEHKLLSFNSDSSKIIMDDKTSRVLAFKMNNSSMFIFTFDNNDGIIKEIYQYRNGKVIKIESEGFKKLKNSKLSTKYARVIPFGLDKLIISIPKNGLFDFDGKNLNKIYEYNNIDITVDKINEDNLLLVDDSVIKKLSIKTNQLTVISKDKIFCSDLKKMNTYSGEIAMDKNGNFWLLNSKKNKVIEYGKNSKTEFKSTDNLIRFNKKLKDVFLDPVKKDVWFQSDTGLTRLYYDQDNKIKTEFIPTIPNLGGIVSWTTKYFSKDAKLWMCGNEGVVSIDLGNYEKNGDKAIQIYNAKNGLFDINCYQLFEDSKSNIWVYTRKGYLKIDTKKNYKNDREPQTHINYIGWNSSGSSNISGKIDEIHYVSDSTNRFELPYNFNPMVIDFIGICLTDGNKVRYKYMLEGLDIAWQEQTENTVKYTSLAPGDYTFKLLACNNNDVWNKEPVTFSFTVQAPWYRNKGAYTGYIIGFISIVFGFNGVRTRQLKLRQQELEQTVTEKTAEVVAQKEFIEEKNKEITDSINYAQRIQRSILPPLTEVKTALPNSFILFKPKDIVSGDFYWFAESGNKILIAAADCTGHGVPGAFMSTIGSEKLNEAVKDSHDVSMILNLVNRGMKKVLRQSGKMDSTRDGMDIALCAFNKESTKVEYAGANRPLWIIRKDAADIEETKATKVAIGGLTEDEQVFTKHTIDLQKGDTVYIFSDGYADQFSPQDKKLMTRKFKETMLSIQNKTMEEQKQFLGSFIENWKGNMEQTDDILVIGIRV